VRETIIGDYRLIYRLKPGLIDVLTLFHGARLMDDERLK
jgi:hypothetical protein